MDRLLLASDRSRPGLAGRLEISHLTSPASRNRLGRNVGPDSRLTSVGGITMTNLKDKTAGTVKEIAGEIIGDGALAEEGNKQRKPPPPADQPPSTEPPSGPDPFEALRKLT